MFTKNHKVAGLGIALICALLIGALKTITTHASPDISDVEVNTPLNPMDENAALGSLAIPALKDWQSEGVAFSHGASGAWDYYLWGGFANSLVKKNGVYYLYYQGSPSYDNQCDSVAYRGIGVAKSVDGVNWTKSENNPVITWSSQGSPEEGAASSAAWVGADGRIYVYYGANSGSDCIVHADARLAVSEDGEHFQDLGVVLSRTAPSVWGSGDELFPVSAYSYNNQWYLYYVPNGVAQARKLGVAAGADYDDFTQSAGLNNATIPSWGPVSVALSGSNAVLFTNPGTAKGLVNLYRFNPSSPSTVSFYDSYTFSDCTQSSILYESNTDRWLMACRNGEQTKYLIKSASAVTSGISPTTLISSKGQDGWILEKSESSNTGGTLNTAASFLKLGDDSANKQYRAILSFDTAALPNAAVITSVTLRFKYAGLSGTDPFTTHGNLLVDVRKGSFNTNSKLELGDFSAKASRNKALSFSNVKVDNWYSQALNAADFQYINLSGVTQFRLRFSKDDNHDFGADFLNIYSGNVNAADRPQLVIEFYIP